MNVGVVKENFPSEKRVALIPADVQILTKLGLSILIETNAGEEAGFSDALYIEKGAKIVKNRTEVIQNAQILAQVRGFGANPENGKSDLSGYPKDQIHIGFMEPLTAKTEIEALREKSITVFSMEMIPRITRAQSMDALSSMANLAGYKAILLASEYLPKIFPMMMTAAGTIVPAKVFVVGVGVAGLQAIATAKRLGAVVKAYDIRPAVKEQVMSLGAKFVEMELDAGDSETKGGYAKAMDENFYRKQRELMTEIVAESDVVITTAAIPGRKAPILVTEDMVKAMQPRSVIVDMAAERGGNCEITEAGKVVVKHGVTIVGITNLPSTLATHASQTYSKNVTNFIKLLYKDQQLNIDMEDPIIAESIITRDSQIINERVKSAFEQQ